MEKPREVFEELFLESLPPRTPESEKKRLLGKTQGGNYEDIVAQEAYKWFTRGRESLDDHFTRVRFKVGG